MGWRFNLKNMIQINELRIGNLVIAGIMIEPISVFTIEFSREEGYLINKSIPVSHLHPIPLTPEILVKCGFIKAYESFHDGIVIMNLHNNDRLDFQYNTEYDKGIAVSNKGEDDGMMFPCQTLHQLQNLYYALTNKELNPELLNQLK
jgi:hypothetical protein